MAGVNYGELKNYVKNFRNFTNSFDSWLKEFLYNRGLELIAKAKLLTPVDTGFLRENWQLGEVTRSGNTLYCFFYNNAYYASWVEYGHAKPYKAGAAPGSADWVEGTFMCTIAMAEIERAMPAKFGREFKAFARGYKVL